jgi:hypothetical protein
MSHSRLSASDFRPATEIDVTEVDELVLAFWKKKIKDLDDIAITVRVGNRVVGYRLVFKDGTAEELNPASIDGVLAGV